MQIVKKLSQSLLSLMSICMPYAALANYNMNMRPGVTQISRDIYGLHMFAFWVCVGIGVVVFGVMFYSIIFHRKSRGYKAANFHEHTTVEVIWAIIPCVLLVIMAIPATKVLLEMEDNADAEVNIQVTGFQWKWKYDYLDEGISFFSNLATPTEQIKGNVQKDKWYLLEVDNPVVVPIHKKIRFLVTANDVIHSWWVPALGIKKDGIPGFIHEVWTRIDKPGTYRGQCAELCGAGHGYMPIVLIAKNEEDYQTWLAEKGAAKRASALDSEKIWSKEDLMDRGKKVYETTCSVCHRPDGKGMPPTFPGLIKSPMIKGPVKDHIDIVVNGKQGTAMQAFGKQLSDAEIAAVITYERNAWGNDMGDVIQPIDIKKAKS